MRIRIDGRRLGSVRVQPAILSILLVIEKLAMNAVIRRDQPQHPRQRITRVIPLFVGLPRWQSFDDSQCVLQTQRLAEPQFPCLDWACDGESRIKTSELHALLEVWH